MSKKSGKNNNICTKIGIKIHETPVCENTDQIEFYNKLKSQNKATGVRITQGENEYTSDPFEGLNPFHSKEDTIYTPLTYDNTSYNNIDLNIENYSREDLFKLFGLQNNSLNENIMKECKKIVLKTHPDKSRLDEKYFIFFAKAYKKLQNIYEFQNKTNNKKIDENEYFTQSQSDILDTIFDKKSNINKDPANFNKWFNDQFDKHKLEDSAQETGYGNWLKSDEDIVFTPNVSKANMSKEINKHKKAVQSLTEYKGVAELTASSRAGTSLMSYDSNFTSGSLFSSDGMHYTDLKQAYVESVIPVTEDDYNKMPKFQNVDEYRRHRDSTNLTPLEKEDAMKQLYHQNKLKDEESVALAFYYAKQSEKVKQKQEDFWSGLKHLTNW
jgi:curved DNA-binding protein CbpA